MAPTDQTATMTLFAERPMAAANTHLAETCARLVTQVSESAARLQPQRKRWIDIHLARDGYGHGLRYSLSLMTAQVVEHGGGWSELARALQLLDGNLLCNTNLSGVTATASSLTRLG